MRATNCAGGEAVGRKTALYSAAHFWVDFSCALLLFGMLSGEAVFGLCTLLYNFCAFALQMPLGLAADRLNRNGLLAALGCGMIAAAYLVPWPAAMAVTAGVGNALFHLGGGIDVLNGGGKRAAALGVFVSPGAAGLALGGLWGRGDAPPLWLGPLGLLVLAAAIGRVCGGASGNAPPELPAADRCGRLALLLFVVVLRSYMGMNQPFSWKGDWLLALTLALALGKAAGGFAMDRLGPRRASAWSLGAAAALYLGAALPLPGTAAVFLFNMTMPVTLWAAARLLPGAKGFAFGLLTFGLFLGFLPSYLSWPNLLSGPWVCAALALGSLGLLLSGLREAEC
ncbi:MAG: hypothetical protein HFG02_03115 [Oscillibacter sp.]|nr:hypothetical protein [Oscillibacter sp.]